MQNAATEHYRFVSFYVLDVPVLGCPVSFRMHAITIYTDGGSRGNPGPSAVGGVLLDANKKVIKEISEYIGERTNNQAEYTALLRALQEAVKLKPAVIDCYMDSELVARQMNGQYKIKDADLRDLFCQIQKLTRGIPVHYYHVRRALNHHADRLVNLALDKQARER
jgi:ribonuclease HI